MAYTLQFGQVTPYLWYLAGGAMLALVLAAIAFLIGWVIGIVCAAVTAYGRGPIRWLVRAYVIFFLNTPVLVQIFFLYFALPEVGILLSSFQAVTIGLSLNAGAYMTEIQRAGFNSVRREEVEAAETLGFSRVQTVRYVILPHICKVLFPPLSNQYILITMTTSIASIFGVEELTGRAYNINAQTFRSLEVFSITAVYYVVLTIIASAVLYFIGRYFFPYQRKSILVADDLERFLTYYNLVFLGKAFLLTASLSFIGCTLGFVAGFGLAVMRHERIVPWAIIRLVALAYTEIFRRIPFLVKLMCVFFAFQLAGADVSMFTVAVTTVALSAAAFSSENIRAALESIHPNQWDAAETLNMGGLTALRRVILPQAWVVMIPPSMTYSVGLVKSTSIASQIGLVELTYAAKVLNNKGISALLTFGTILVLYFILCYSLNRFAAWLEARLDAPRHRQA